jgi:hypothetical protein
VAFQNCRISLKYLSAISIMLPLGDQSGSISVWQMRTLRAPSKNSGLGVAAIVR